MEEIVDMIMKKIIEEGCRKHTYGLRCDNHLYDIGQITENSGHWYDEGIDYQEETELDGTRATEIDLCLCFFEGYDCYEDDPEGLQDELNELRKEIKKAVNINILYESSYWYLLAADEVTPIENFLDEQEVIMKNAKVILRLK